jgi:hypothetical protein
VAEKLINQSLMVFLLQSLLLRFVVKQIATFFIDVGAAVDTVTNGGATPLVVAACLASLSLEIVKMLIKRGAPVDNEVEGWGTPTLALWINLKKRKK